MIHNNKKLPGRNHGIQVISRAAAILRACGGHGVGKSLGDLATAVDLPRSTVQRIVGALADEGLLQAEGTARSIRLGPEIHALSNASRVDMVELAHPFLKQLAEQTGETVDLSVLRNDHAVFLDQVAGSHRLRAVSAVGEKFPLRSTANGKACLAMLRQQGRSLPRAISSMKAADRRKLESELAAIARTGLATDIEEHTAGICALGTAFTDPAGQVYAISIPMPAVRFKAAKARCAELLTRARVAIAAAMQG